MHAQMCSCMLKIYWFIGVCRGLQDLSYKKFSICYINYRGTVILGLPIKVVPWEVLASQTKD